MRESLAPHDRHPYTALSGDLPPRPPLLAEFQHGLPVEDHPWACPTALGPAQMISSCPLFIL